MAPLKKSNEPTYSYGDPVLMAMRVAAARRPPLYAGAQREFAEMVSAEVRRQEWQILGEDVLRPDGSDMRLKVAAVLEAIGGDGKRYNTAGAEGYAGRSPQWVVKLKADLGDLY